MNNMMKALAVSLGFFIPISTFMTNVVLGLLLVLWSRWSNVKQLPQLWKEFSTLKGVALFLGVVGIGCLYSIGSAQDILYSLKKSAKLLSVFILLPLFFERQWRMRAYWAFLAAVGLTVLFALLEHLQLYHLPKGLFHVEPTRPDVFKDTLYTALLVAMGTFAAAQLISEYQTRIKWVIGLGAFVALSTYSMLWVNTGRSGQLIFVSLWCLFCFRVWRFKGLCWGSASLLAILALAWVSPASSFSERWTEVFDAVRFKIEHMAEQKLPRDVIISPVEDLSVQLAEAPNEVPDVATGSTAIRLNIWKEGLGMMKTRPWFGSGTGSFQTLAANAATEQADTVHASVAKNPHNQYLNIGIQQGIVGLCALLGLFGCLLKASCKLPRVESGLLQGIVVAMAIGCLGNSWLTDFTSGYLFVWLVSVTIAAGCQNNIRGEGHVSCV